MYKLITINGVSLPKPEGEYSITKRWTLGTGLEGHYSWAR